MGLEGDDIVNFVYKQQELYRDERAEKRAARAAEAEHAEWAAEAEREIEPEVHAESDSERARNSCAGIDEFER